ncbi:caspase recruitment domain-containing protein 19 isoform X4 [Taeniopygia guttata]|uniref:caspase recruitment domain-containing protein 19 isoform X4 n=1 Tax=Taeniopygia guttata TaxID=59729 RepID=UPI0011AEE1ED|nr:caspase recruitment domain-containing protein 19 isoform X2 [Taeniopygia guttata]
MASVKNGTTLPVLDVIAAFILIKKKGLKQGGPRAEQGRSRRGYCSTGAGCSEQRCPRCSRWSGAGSVDQSYCHRLQHDMYFLTSTSRLNEQVVDKIVLQLNRVYPQILTNEEAEKFRNPKASLHTRLSDLLKHLQKKGDRHCQEFYRALQINAELLFNDLPSRKILSPVFFLACFSMAAGLAFFWYCCNSETQVTGRARRILGFSPIIIGRHVRNICMLYLEDMSKN